VPFEIDFTSEIREIGLSVTMQLYMDLFHKTNLYVDGVYIGTPHTVEELVQIGKENFIEVDYVEHL